MFFASTLLLVAAVTACGSTDSPKDTLQVNPGPGGGNNDKDSGDNGFVVDDDAGNHPVQDAGGEAAATCNLTPPNDGCGLAPQCGCNANETCDITNTTSGAVGCVKAGTKSLGRACTATGECLEGLTCQFGSCRPYCAKVGVACTVAGTGVCIAATDENSVPLPNSTICTLNCDPVSPEALCGTGNTCLWFPSLYAPAKVTDCSFPGDNAPLAACSTDYDCGIGYACDPTKSKCEKWCRLGGGFPGDCTTGSCKDVYGADAPTISGVKEGLCQ